MEHKRITFVKKCKMFSEKRQATSESTGFDLKYK